MGIVKDILNRDDTSTQELKNLGNVRYNGLALKLVKDRTPKICLEAVKQDGRALYCIREQTPEMHLEAVKQNG